jgi:hypothetical protein
MPAKVDDHWKRRLTSLKSNHPDWGAFRLLNALTEEAQAIGTRPPSQGWISQWLREKWPKVTPIERRNYLDFCWPQSMQNGLLPMEASAAALELLDVRSMVDPVIRQIEQESEPIGYEWESMGLRWGRPSVRLARWFWYVTQAAPDLPAVSRPFPLPPDADIALVSPPGIDIPGRYDIAVALAELEADPSPGQALRDKIERYLSFGPWRSLDRALDYKLKVDHGYFPGLTLRDLEDYENDQYWRRRSVKSQ